VQACATCSAVLHCTSRQACLHVCISYSGVMIIAYDYSTASISQSVHPYRLRALLTLKVPLLLVLGMSVACGLYEKYRAPEMSTLQDLDLSFAYNVCNFALALLLVFKTNSCYGRYWEGVLLLASRSVANILHVNRLLMKRANRLPHATCAFDFSYVLHCSSA
jgi:Bestrophin, RFP-TM, chloride channel